MHACVLIYASIHIDNHAYVYITIITGVRCTYGDDTGLYLSYECYDDLCVAERALSTTDMPITTYYCLNKNANPHWRESCNGLKDSATNVVQCCLEDDCYLQLSPRLPSEPAVSTSYPPYRPFLPNPTTAGMTVGPTRTTVSIEPTPNSVPVSSAGPTTDDAAYSTTIPSTGGTNCKFVQ